MYNPDIPNKEQFILFVAILFEVNIIQWMKDIKQAFVNNLFYMLRNYTFWDNMIGKQLIGFKWLVTYKF